MFWTGQKANPVTTHGQSPSDQEVVFCMSTTTIVCATVLNHAPVSLCRTRDLQWLPNEAPHFREAISASFSYIRVILYHPEARIHLPHTFTHAISLPTLT